MSNVVEDLVAHREQLQAIAEEKRNASAKIIVEVSPVTYGLLAEASLMLGCGITEALQKFVNESDALPEWLSAGAPI